MLPIITEGEARGDYSIGAEGLYKQLRDLLECNNQLRLWDIYFCKKFLMRCVMDFRNLINFKRSKYIMHAIV